MKLYDGGGPNPKAVRMFIAEKGITDIEVVAMDLVGGENRQPEHLRRNPSGQLPVLETDSGLFVSEVPSICEYLEEICPGPALIGASAEERAETRTWLRKLDLALCEPMSNGFRFGERLEFFSQRIPCYPETAPALKKMAQNGLALLNTQLEAKRYICGDRFSLADIFVFCLVSFFSKMGQPVDNQYTHVHAFLEHMNQRPSAQA